MKFTSKRDRWKELIINSNRKKEKSKSNKNLINILNHRCKILSDNTNGSRNK